MKLSNKEALAFEILVVCVWNCLVGCLWWWWWWWWGWCGKVVINVPPTRLPPSRLSTTIWTQQWHFHHSNVEQHSLEGSTNKSIWMCYALQCHCQSHEWGGQQGHIRFWSTHHSLLILLSFFENHLIIEESSHHNTITQSPNRNICKTTPVQL